MRDTITSITGPRSYPSKWISSMITKPIRLTYPLYCQCLEIPSHFSGVVMMICASSSDATSGVKSPVNSTIFFPNYFPNLSPQSSMRSLASAFKGAI